jgi:hypothetical protein
VFLISGVVDDATASATDGSDPPFSSSLGMTVFYSWLSCVDFGLIHLAYLRKNILITAEFKVRRIGLCMTVLASAKQDGATQLVAPTRTLANSGMIHWYRQLR